ncbi:hypothetical protein [Photobacterium leiognathi]|uniref:hypothetical protein n=1 Tax=Photobacterium leiognathi TaxID=553611 RepID=UPI0029813D2F|nr:hypothetical protein [Photobacterium leiognathi]
MYLTGFKIVEKKNGQYLTLFHGNFGSRKLTANEWITAQIRDKAKDGTSKSVYRSGFHIIPTLDETKAYLTRFKAPRELVIVKVLYPADTFWLKEHSPSNIHLSESMMIIEEVDHA